MLVGTLQRSTRTDTSFLQMFLWKQVGALDLKAVEFLTIEMRVVMFTEGSRKIKGH